MSKAGKSEHKVALVTGATGFVGRHLVLRLVREGWKVHIVIREGSKHGIPELAQAINHAHDGTTEGMIALVAEAKPDAVFHLASLFLSQHEPKDIASLVLSNILFGNQLLEAMRINGVSQFINTGTSWQHFNNEDYNPVCLYAATKQAFEDILAYYIEAASIKAITLQLFDTYGPEDPRPKLFHLLEKTAKSQEPLSMSPGEQLIDLVYIDDVIDAYLCAHKELETMAAGRQVYAVSSGNPIPLKVLVQQYAEITKQTIAVNWGARPYRYREVLVPWNRGKRMEGWLPKISLIKGIRSIIQRNLGVENKKNDIPS